MHSAIQPTYVEPFTEGAKLDWSYIHNRNPMGTILLRAKTLNVRVSSDVLIPSIQPVRHRLMRWDAKMNITPHTSTIRMRTFFAVRTRKFTFGSLCRAQLVSSAVNNRNDGSMYVLYVKCLMMLDIMHV